MVSLQKIFGLGEFPLRFAGGASLNAYDIVKLGPLSSAAAKSYKRILILSKREKRDLAERLADDFKEGYSANKKIFPGLSKVLRTEFEIDVAYFSEYDPDEVFSEFENSGRVHETFPVIILPRCAKGDYGSIYYRTKAAFLRHEVPSQVVTEELIRNESAYRWSLLSLAVQLCTKMGCVPYGLNRSVMNLKSLLPSDTLVAVIGLGISTHPQRRKRGVGFITVYDDVGVWKFMDFEILSMDKRDEMSNSVASLLERGIRDIVERGSKENNVIVIHYSGKELGTREEESIINAIQTLRLAGRNVYVHVLKVRESDIVVGLEESPHRTREGLHTWYPPIGVVFKLKPDIYLMTSTGYFVRDSGHVGSNIRAGLPTAMIVSRHREVEINPLKDVNDIDLLSTVFGLMRLNYVDVSHPVSREPVTTRYSRAIAWIVLRLADVAGSDLELRRFVRLRNTMWFL